ncbi:PAQR family membrane homeostasis protein TrhA, partial [Streptomyces sp. NPDC002740]
MIAEDAQPPVHGRDPQPAPDATLDALHPPAADAPPGPTGPRTAGRTVAGLEGGVERAAAVLKPKMRGWLHAGVFPLALAGGIVLIVVS